MKHDRSPALNRFENDLARAIDERAARSTVRRNARVLALASLVVLALAAGVTYEWLQSRDTSTEVATSGPHDPASTTIVASGKSNGEAWRLTVGPDVARGPSGAPRTAGVVCVSLAAVVNGTTTMRSACGTPAELDERLASVTAAEVLHVAGTTIWAGHARADIGELYFLGPDDDPITMVETIADDRAPGGRYWFLDADLTQARTVVFATAEGTEISRMPMFESDAPLAAVDRANDRAAIQRAANAGIIGNDTDDPDAFIDDPRGIKAQRDGLAAAYPEQVGHTSLVMQSITFTSPTEAEFVYDVLLAPPLDQQSLHGLVGHAVLVDDVWKVTRATACQVWGFGTGTCPPPG